MLLSVHPLTLTTLSQRCIWSLTAAIIPHIINSSLLPAQCECCHCFGNRQYINMFVCECVRDPSVLDKVDMLWVWITYVSHSALVSINGTQKPIVLKCIFCTRAVTSNPPLLSLPRSSHCCTVITARGRPSRHIDNRREGDEQKKRERWGEGGESCSEWKQGPCNVFADFVKNDIAEMIIFRVLIVLLHFKFVHLYPPGATLCFIHDAVSTRA